MDSRIVVFIKAVCPLREADILIAPTLYFIRIGGSLLIIDILNEVRKEEFLNFCRSHRNKLDDSV
ncbi:hypothetical protein D3C80_1763350 [compost metagenome]